MESLSPETHNELFKALALTQGQIHSATKSKDNPAFKRDGKASTYADIADVIEVIQKAASDNGLSVIFNYKTDDHGTFIQYRLGHSSGQYFLSDWVFMFLRDATAHAFGASNTFMRRQLLKSIYQIPEEDDDGNKASLKKERQKEDPMSTFLPDMTMEIGKFAGKTLKEVLGIDSAQNYQLAHWARDNIKSGKAMHSSYKLYLEYAEDEGVL